MLSASISPVTADVWKEPCGSSQTLFPGPLRDGAVGTWSLGHVSRHFLSPTDVPCRPFQSKENLFASSHLGLVSISPLTVNFLIWKKVYFGGFCEESA